MIERADITGLVLCGGRGSRMGGVDKGLQAWHGTTLAGHALARLAPQVGRSALNANRNLERYAALGVPVWPDAVAGFPGPLAGFLAGLAHCDTGWLLTVPCDAPLFPPDLVQRLARAIDAGSASNEPAIAVAASTGPEGERLQPVFCLMPRGARASLQRFVDAGGRKVEQWTAAQHAIVVRFDDPQSFTNANTLAELEVLQHGDG